MDILKKLKIITEVSNEDRNPKLGRRFSTARKFNAWNPLSYIILFVGFLFTIILSGVKETFASNSPWRRNPFKWD